MASQWECFTVELWFTYTQIKALVLLFDPCLIIRRASWKSVEATMTCPDPNGRVGTKCPILGTLTWVTLLITWMVPQKPAGSFMQAVSVAEGRSPDF